jgi:hypothetical protein
MSESTRRVLLTCGTIAIVVVLCLGICGVLAAGVYFVYPNLQIKLDNPGSISTPTSTQVAVEIQTQETSPDQAGTSSPSSSPTFTPVPPSVVAPTRILPTAQPSLQPNANNLPPAISNQMDKIQQQVIQLRGLQAKDPVQRAILTSDQLRTQVEQDTQKNYPVDQAKNDAIELSAFGLINQDFDLYNLQINLQAEQVAGYYDDETKKMYVISDEGFHGPERLTYAHEFTHFLQDQTWDIRNGLNYRDDTCKIDTERCAGIQALIEGDATVLEFQWLHTYGTPQDIIELQQFYNKFKDPIYESAPEFMKEDLLFPYSAGEQFVQSIYDQGGWDAVDRVYKDPPLSTAQIMHPERYPNDKPVQVTLPDLGKELGNGWRQVNRSTLGEWYTYLVLAKGLDPKARLSDSEAKAGSDGWSGDQYLVYYNDQTHATAMVMTTVWDNTSDAGHFATAFQDFTSARFGDPSTTQNHLAAWTSTQAYTEFHYNGSQTTWILAPDAQTAASLWNALPTP